MRDIKIAPIKYLEKRKLLGFLKSFRQTAFSERESEGI